MLVYGWGLGYSLSPGVEYGLSQYRSGLGLFGYTGASYYFNDHWAVFAELASFAYTGGTLLGALYRF